MKFRWSIKELENLSDEEVIRGILAERKSELNIYCPLYKKINELYNLMDDLVNKKISIKKCLKK